MSAHNDNARLETFCDGVIAIAITLLILEIKIPKVDSVHSVSDLWHHLAEEWPSWFGFALSFIAILISWVNHHNVFKLIDKSTPPFVYANGFFLITIVVMPFTTALMAEYIGTDYAQPAISLYCFSTFFHNIAWCVLSYTTLKPLPLAKDDESQQLGMIGINNTRRAFFLYLFIFILSFWFPVVSLISITVSWLSWLVIGIWMTPYGKKHKQGCSK